MLCIDPESRLPFMINMDLKMADICDLDNRMPFQKQKDGGGGGEGFSDIESEYSVDRSSRRTFTSRGSQKHTKPDILAPWMYPFYHKVKRSLYMIE